MFIRCVDLKIFRKNDFFGKKTFWTTLLNLTFLITCFRSINIKYLKFCFTSPSKFVRIYLTFRRTCKSESLTSVSREIPWNYIDTFNLFTKLKSLVEPKGQNSLTQDPFSVTGNGSWFTEFYTGNVFQSTPSDFRTSLPKGVLRWTGQGLDYVLNMWEISFKVLKPENWTQNLNSGGKWM